jgi:TRAP-type C4-dicarboxylate transport system permease small subunit
MPKRPSSLLQVHRLARVLAVAGGLVVVGLALTVTASVLLRWLANGGVKGDFEIVQLGLALAVFSFLPLCQARRGNIMVDTFTSRLPDSVQRGLDAFWDLVLAAFAGLIAWRLWLGAGEAISSRTSSMVLGMPIGWAIGAASIMAAILALVCVVTAIERWGRSA